MKTLRFILTGGGTGGHIYPAIAIADRIKKEYKDAEILFVGTEKGLESEIVPSCGYNIETITVSGFNRKKVLKNINTIKKVVKGLKEANEIINSFKPDMVIGTGGYVCGPVVFAAALKGIKTVIHEQNAFPGVTNKILSKFVDKIFISFEESKKYFKSKSKIILSGNPLREQFTTQDTKIARKQLGLNESDFCVICFGGSRGAEKINEYMVKAIEVLNGIEDIKLFFVTGKVHYDLIMNEIEKSNIKLSENIVIMDYIHNMAEYMSACDLVISRAGAITIAEINASGKTSILIPSPHVTGNHQYYNAKVVADRGGAYLIEEKDLNEEKIISIIFKLKNSRRILDEMGMCSKKMSHTDAVEVIFTQLKELF